jgi:hypothetical protein
MRYRATGRQPSVTDPHRLALSNAVMGVLGTVSH